MTIRRIKSISESEDHLVICLKREENQETPCREERPPKSPLLASSPVNKRNVPVAHFSVSLLWIQRYEL
jgi:hypothetical protein